MNALQKLEIEFEKAENYLNKFESKDYIFKNSLRQIQQAYQTIAWHNWFIDKNIEKTKSAFFNSAMTIIHASQLFDGETSSLLSKPRITLSEIALSDSTQLIKKLSDLDFMCPNNSGKMELFSNLIKKGEIQIYTALIIKAMVGDKSGLEELLNIIQNNPIAKKRNEWFTTEIPFFEGILKNDKDKIYNTISHLSSPKEHKITNSYNGTYKELISFPAIGYAKIAWLNNIELEFENPLLINELLPIKPISKYINEIELLIPKMTLESEYKFHNGLKVKQKSDVFDVFIFSHPQLHGKNCVTEELVPNILDFESNFIGLKSFTKYKEGLLVGTSRKLNKNILLEQIQKTKKIGLFKKKKALSVLQKYLADIDEVSKTQRGVVLKLDGKFNLEYTKEERPTIPKKTKAISKAKKESFKELGQLCLSNLAFEIYKDEIKSLKNYDSDEEYGSTLNFLSESLSSKGILFLISLDWKTEITVFENYLIRSIKENFSETLDINISELYSETSSISADSIFQKYNESIKHKGYELTLLDTDSDSYTFFINKLGDSEQIDNLIKKIGFKSLKSKTRYNNV